ncbi:MAG: polysaccharide pyruvyl transferase CsaB [Acidobacteriota bacterium]|nr:polysaccharide pyruvyl transferase CsaB [Acidobacteriota bacterium]
MTDRAPVRFLISGYYGFGNAGDEAVLEAILQGLDRRFPGHETCVLSAHPDATAALYEVRAVQRWSLPVVWRELGRATVLIQGGGGLIQDTTSRVSPAYYLGILAMARARRVPTMVFAQGVGPIRTGFVRWWTGYEFRRAGIVTVRDPASLELMAELRVRGATLVADPALLLEHADGPLDERISQLGLDEEAPRAILAVRRWPGGEHALEACAAAGSWLRENAGCEVLVAAFQEPDDVEAAQTVAAQIPGAHVLTGRRRAAELAKQVAAARVVVSMRLHGLIFAAAHAVPAVGISYDPKVRAFAELAGQPWVDLPDCTPERLVQVVSETWAASENHRNDLEQTARGLLSDAERSFELLEQLVASLDAIAV